MGISWLRERSDHGLWVGWTSDEPVAAKWVGLMIVGGASLGTFTGALCIFFIL